MRPAQRVALAVVGVVATVGVLASIRGTAAPPPSPATATPAPTRTAAAVRLGDPASFVGPSFGVAGRDPTSTVAQSKVWFNDGRWWAILWSAATGDSRIHVLDPAGLEWRDTGVVVDERAGARADVLAEDGRIVVVTGRLNPGSTRDAIQLIEFTYDPERAAYDLAPDFPVPLIGHGVESVVVARDAVGRLWATYVDNGELIVDRTDGDDHRWLGPIKPDIAATSRFPTIVALSDRVIVLATNTAADALDVWIHRNRDPDDHWTAARHEVRGLGATATPIVARVARSGSVEEVVAVARTTLDRTDVNGLAPLVLLMRLAPDGALHSSVFGRVEDGHREPTLLIDEAAQRVYVIAMATLAGERVVVYKAADLADPVFESGVGSILAESTADPSLSTPSVPRQAFGGHGVVVLAADSSTTRYVSSAADVPGRELPPAVTERTLVNDAFDAWPAGTPVGDAWWVVQKGALSTATIEEGAGANGGAMVLAADADGNGERACRTIEAVGTGTVHATVELRLGAVGRTAGGVWLRGDGEQGASIRFEGAGTLSVYDGAEIVRSTVRYAPGTWYRVTFEAAVAERTYTWSIQDRDTGRQLLAASGLAWRSPLATLVDELCVDAPSGAAGIEMRVDAVLVSRR